MSMKRRMIDEQRGSEKRLKSQHVSKPETKLLDLPKEMLCLIAQKFPNRADVLNLALTNKKAYDTLSAVLSAEIKITIPTAWKILKHLCVSPTSAQKVTYLDLTDFECPHPTQPCPCIGMGRYIARCVAARNGQLYSITEETRDGIRQGLLTAPNYVWLEPQAALLQLLISQCRNLKSLAIELPDPFKFDAYHRRTPQGGNFTLQRLRELSQGLPPIPPFEGRLLTDLQAKLEMLVVTEDCHWQGPHNEEDLSITRWMTLAAHTLTFAGFSRLKSLDVLMTSLDHPRYLVFGDASGELIRPHNENNKTASHKQFVLPCSLIYLRLRSCNAFIFLFLLRVLNMPRDKLKLKTIEIDMNCCAQSLIYRCHNADEGRYSYEAVLNGLKKRGTVVTWNAGNVPDTYERRVNMMAALAVFYSLNPHVLWRKVRWASEKFPEAKARVALGPPEQPQHLVYDQSFHPGPVFRRVPRGRNGRPFQPPGMSSDPLPMFVNLLNSPRFNALAWVDVAIFHATVHWTNQLERVYSDKREIATVWRHHSKGHLPKLYDLYRYEFSFRVQKTLLPPMAKFHFFGATYDQPPADSRAPRLVFIHKVEEALFDIWHNNQHERLRKQEERRREQGETGLERAFATLVAFRGDVDVKIHCTHVSQLREMRFDASQWMHLPWATILHPWDEDFGKEP